MKIFRLILFALTAGVIGFAWWFISLKGGWVNFQKMDLNEFGDFLAGTSASLAFFWLVFGFFQQGEELKHNSETLKL